MVNRLLCQWNFPGKNTGVGCHFLLQGIFSTQGSNPHLLHWQADTLSLSLMALLMEMHNTTHEIVLPPPCPTPEVLSLNLIKPPLITNSRDTQRTEEHTDITGMQSAKSRLGKWTWNHYIKKKKSGREDTLTKGNSWNKKYLKDILNQSHVDFIWILTKTNYNKLLLLH